MISRQHLILIMALVLATLASIGWAQETIPSPPADPVPQLPARQQTGSQPTQPEPTQHGTSQQKPSRQRAVSGDCLSCTASSRGSAALAVPDHGALDHLSSGSSSGSGGAVPAVRSGPGSRPVYAEMTAVLANFDRDVGPDGWRAAVVLRDHADQPVAMRSRATFELWPRREWLDGTSSQDWKETPLQWNVKLQFDDQGVARVKLPLRDATGGRRRGLSSHRGGQTHLAFTATNGPRSRLHRTERAHGRSRSRHRNHSRSFQTRDLQQALALPTLGEMRVRVLVPTEGVFAASWLVPLQPSFLVDTPWPSR